MIKLNIERIKNEINIPETLIFIFLITFFCAKTFSMPDLLANGLIALSGIICFAYAAWNNKISKWEIFGAVTLSILMFLSAFFNKNASFLEILWIWCYLGAAIMIKKFNIDSKKIGYLLLAITLIYGVKILLGIDATDAINTGSGNNISTYILFYVFLIYIKRYEEGEKIIYWPCIISIVLSVWGNGRAGLLASILMFGLIFFYDYKFVSKNKNDTLKKVAILGIITILIACIFLGSYLETFFAKIIKYGYSSVRIEIYWEYIINSFKSIGNFLLGVPMVSDTTPLLTKYAGNPHNAFIMLHAKYGIIGFIWVIFLLKDFFIKCRKEKKYIYLIILIVWFVRSMLDWTGFPGIFDVLFFYFALFIYENSKKNDNINIKNIIKKIYSFCASTIYKMTSKKTIIKTSELFNTSKMTKYHHIVSALRYVAIEEHYGKNNFGMDLYIKANKWENEEHLKQDLEKFKELINSIEINGYNMNSEIYMDLNNNCFNGTHRLALCAWFGIKEIPVAIIKRHLTIQSVEVMKKYYNLSNEDYERLEKAYQRMRKRLKNK